MPSDLPAADPTRATAVRWFRRHKWQADRDHLGYRTGTIRCRYCGRPWGGKFRLWSWGCPQKQRGTTVSAVVVAALRRYVRRST